MLFKVPSFSQEKDTITLDNIKIIDSIYQIPEKLSEKDLIVIIPKDKDLKFAEFGGLDIPEGVTVKILSSIDAKLSKIFYGKGNVDLSKLTNKYIFTEWWGANPNDSRDDYEALQKTFNSGVRYKTIKFFSGNYNISKPIIIKYPGVTLLGIEGFSSGLPILNFNSAKIQDTFFHFQYPKDCNILNLKFVNLNSTYQEEKTTKTTQQTCIKFHCDQKEALENAYWANLDGIVKNCIVSGFYKSLISYGRNLIIKENVFSGYHIAIDIKYDENFKKTEDLHPEKYFETHLLGFRGYDISHNRFHAGKDASILVEGYNSENLYGCKLTNNIHDTACTFFRGSLSESIISDNIIHRVYLKPAIHLYNSNHLIINDNFISGEKHNHETKRMKLYPIWAEYGIVFENRAFNNSIIGNHLNNIKKDAILFKNLCSNTIISQNIISDFGLGLDKGTTPPLKYHNEIYEAYSGSNDGYAAIRLAYNDNQEKNPFMNQFINNNISLRIDKVNYGIWITKKLDNSIISPNISNLNQTNSNSLYLYEYQN